MRRWFRVRRVPERNRWRNREREWRRLHIEVETTEGGRAPFTRYEYGKAWAVQAGLCGLCHAPLPLTTMEALSGFGEVATGRGISVDHDHGSRLFRSLTHGHCNMAISNLTLERAKQVVSYIEEHLASQSWKSRSEQS